MFHIVPPFPFVFNAILPDAAALDKAPRRLHGLENKEFFEIFSKQAGKWTRNMELEKRYLGIAHRRLFI